MQDEMLRHYTATVLVVHQDRVLLHQHKKFNSLLPVGGHVDPNELPEEAALREVQEETGLTVQLYNPDSTVFPDVRLLVRPVHLLLFNIREPGNPHQHIDYIFYATAETDQVAPSAGESERLQWYRRDEILTAAMPTNVRILALEALDLLGKKG
jgi:8-oxo-dGTP pyrophosphatase MutT (NUDIX family)